MRLDDINNEINNQVNNEIGLMVHRDRLRVLAGTDAYDEIMEVVTGTSTAVRREGRRVERDKLIGIFPRGRAEYDQVYRAVWSGAMDEARRRVSNAVDGWLAGDDNAKADVAVALRGRLGK